MNVVKEKDIVFAKLNYEDLTADLYFSQNGKEMPILLYIHGGGWKAGSKEMFNDWGPYFAKNGFFTMSINYRLSTPECPSWPGVMDDMKSALVWLVESASHKWNVDIERIGIIGESCGAQLAAILAMENETSARIRTIVGVYGIYDVEAWWDYTQKNREDNPVGNLFGAGPAQLPEVYRKASPLFRMDDEISAQFLDISFLFLWGEADDIVPPSQSEKFIQKLENLGMRLDKHVIPDSGHYWFSILPWLEGGTVGDYPNRVIAPKLLDFLKKELSIHDMTMK